MNERIKQLRKELGLTQQQFADKIGIKRTTIATYENGRNSPIDAVISLICREFNVNETWLRNGSGDMFQNDESRTAPMPPPNPLLESDSTRADSYIQPIDLKFLSAYNSLNTQGKEKACDLVELLLKIPNYKMTE